jgi:hypothetical protein
MNADSFIELPTADSVDVGESEWIFGESGGRVVARTPRDDVLMYGRSPALRSPPYELD